MRVPTSLLRQRIRVEEYIGETGSAGAAYGPPKEMPARVQRTRRRVRTADGNDVIAAAIAWVRPDRHVPAQARVTEVIAGGDGRTYTVVDVADAQGLTRPTHREVVLQ